MSTTFPDSPALLDSTGRVIAQKLQGIIDALGGGGGTVIIEEYDSSVLRYPNTGETGGYTYKVGDYCSYNDAIYFCKTPINWNSTTPPGFDSTKWYDATDDIVTELSKKPGIVIASPNQYGSSFIELFGNIGTHQIYNSGHDFAHVEGCGNKVGDSSDASKNAQNSHVEGYGNTICGYSTHAEGENNIAKGRDSHAEGNRTEANGQCSHAEGQNSKANGDYCHVEGQHCNSQGNCSHVEGNYNYNYGDYNHVEGSNNDGVYGSYNHVEGGSNNLDSAGGCQYNHLEGLQNKIYKNSTTNANGYHCHAEGSNNYIYGGYANHAEGNNNYIYGPSSCHVEGQSCYANTFASHAGGQNSQAGGYGRQDGVMAFAHGLCVQTYNVCETAFGAYNDSKDAKGNISMYSELVSYTTGDKVRYNGTIYEALEDIVSPSGAFDPTKWDAGSMPETYATNPTIFSVGNGTANDDKSNAFEVLQDGTGYLKNNKRIITTEEIPDPPTADGTYTLQVTVSNGQLTYSWV